MHMYTSYRHLILGIRCWVNLQKADLSPVSLRGWPVHVYLLSKKPPRWKVLDVCKGHLPLLLVHYSLLQCPCRRANSKALVSMMCLLGCPGVFGSILLLLHLPDALSSLHLTHWLDFGLFMVSLWINKTQTINGPNLRSMYSPSPLSCFVSQLTSAPFSWKMFRFCNFSHPETSKTITWIMSPTYCHTNKNRS